MFFDRKILGKERFAIQKVSTVKMGKVATDVNGDKEVKI